MQGRNHSLPDVMAEEISSLTLELRRKMIRTVLIKCNWSPVGSPIGENEVYTDTAAVALDDGSWSVKMVLHGQLQEQEFVGGGEGYMKEAVAFMRAVSEYYYVTDEMKAWFRHILLLDIRCDKLVQRQKDEQYRVKP